MWEVQDHSHMLFSTFPKVTRDFQVTKHGQASRWYYNFLDINLYMEALDAFGIDSERPNVTAIGRMFLMSLGTIATVYFVLIGSRARDA